MHTDGGRVARTKPKSNRKWILVGGLILLVAIVLAGMILASLNRALTHANAIACSSNLRQLGMALQMYAAGHDQMLPKTWQQLAGDQNLTSDVFLCPGDHRQDRAPGTTTREWASKVDQPDGSDCAYVLAGGFLPPKDTEDVVVAFERIGGHSNWGANILFGDGHVEILSLDAQSSERVKYDHLLADHAAGVRPLKLRP